MFPVLEAFEVQPSRSGVQNGGVPMKYAPYSKQTIQAGTPTNDVRVFAGIDAWRQAKENSYPWRLVLPLDDNPNLYKWPVVNADVLLFDCGQITDNDLQTLACTLLVNGANVVRVIQGEHMAVFRGDYA